MSYLPPLKEMLFAINELAELPKLAMLPELQDSSPDLAQAILTEAGKLAKDVLLPLNHVGDQQPSSWSNGVVTMSPGFKEAFAKFSEGGWLRMDHPQEWGGQGLAKVLATACRETFYAANLSLVLCPLLTDGVIESLLLVGTEAQKQRFIPPLISGEWTGTMNLTEAQAGSDLALVKSIATAQADGTYKITGTKIFISYGDHDLSENIIHLVLARTPGAPPGVKGISLFAVPKIIVNEDGSLGERNDIECISIEHKLGIKASPTAVLQFGNHGGAVCELIGEENRGLEYMFIMMNAARFGVGIQGVGVAAGAYQKAVAYAKERLQGNDLNGSTGAVAIINHPDVRRLLMRMRALTEGARAMTYVTAAAKDLAHYHHDAKVREDNRAFYELMVPIVKGYSTEMAVSVASDALQVHGGMGFIEETGIAQYYRDVRITSIYEGTTAIQANDLINRKTLRDNGAAVRAFCARIADVETQLMQRCADCVAFAERLREARSALNEVLEFILTRLSPPAKNNPNNKSVFAGSVLYLKLMGIVASGWQFARALIVAQDKLAEDTAFYDAKIKTAQFFAQTILPTTSALAHAIINGGEHTNALSAEQF